MSMPGLSPIYDCPPFFFLFLLYDVKAWWPQIATPDMPATFFSFVMLMPIFLFIFTDASAFFLFCTVATRCNGCHWMHCQGFFLFKCLCPVFYQISMPQFLLCFCSAATRHNSFRLPSRMHHHKFFLFLNVHTQFLFFQMLMPQFLFVFFSVRPVSLVVVLLFLHA